MLFFRLPKFVKFSLSLLIPLLAAIIQWYLWSVLSPLTWLLFFPAVFLSAFINGLVGGLLTTSIAVVLALYIFTPPLWDWAYMDARAYFSTGVFISVGIIISLICEKLHLSFTELERIHKLNLGLNEQLTNVSLQSIKAGIWTWNVDTGQIYWSESFWKLLGLEAVENEPSYDLWLSTVCAKQRADLAIKINKALSNGKEVNVEWPTAKLFGGKPRWLMLSGNPVNATLQMYQGIIIDITQRKEKEIAAHYINQQYYAFFDQAAPDAMYIHDHNGNIIDVNQQACISVGYSKEELLNMNVTDLEQDFDLASAQAVWISIELGERKILFGHQRSKDGSLFPVEVHFGLSLFDEKRLYFVIVRNITEQQQLHDQLKSNEARLRSFLDNSLTVAWIKNIEGTYIYVSPNFEKRFFKGDIDWVSKTDFDLWPQHTAHKFFENKKQILKTMLPSESIEHIQEIDGTVSSWQTSRFVFQDGQGDMLIGGIGVDITERIRQEGELKNYRDNLDLQFRQLLAATVDGFWLVGKDGKLEDVNQVYIELSGYSRDELLSMSVPDLEAMESPEQVQERIAETFVRKSVQFETQHQTKEGELLDVEVSINFHERTGKFVVFIRDIRERKQKLQEEVLAREESELRLHRAIIAEQELLRVYEKTSQKFGRELHDDLGQQLTALAMLSEILSQNLQQENSLLCQSSQKITKRLNEAVSQVRLMSHELCPISSDYGNLIDMLGMLIEQTSGLDKLTCGFHFDPDRAESYFGYVDLPAEERNIQFFRIAQEAITNAIKHSRATHIELLLRHEDNGDVLEINDNGIGLSSNNADGFGMDSMLFRANMLGAQINFISNHQGLSVSVYLPRQATQTKIN